MTANGAPAQSWTCPDCSWSETAHPAYGWSTHNDRAVEVHRKMLCPWRHIEPCRLGYQEYDGARYCHEHGGFLQAGVQSRMCDRHPDALALATSGRDQTPIEAGDA